MVAHVKLKWRSCYISVVMLFSSFYLSTGYGGFKRSDMHARRSSFFPHISPQSKVPSYGRNYKASIRNNSHKSKIDDGNDDSEETLNATAKPKVNQLNEFLDSFLEVPDSRLLAGDLLFLLIVNFLLQIGDEIGDPNFWLSGGFSQPVKMPTTLLALIARDSKMSISWVLSALWNRSYSTSSVAESETALKKSLEIWVDYCSIRILLEIGGSVLFSHIPVNVWSLAREVWYTAIVMAFFRFAYGKIWTNRF
mmetsp:Transcript_60/g.139  ORF Transcript_60/g.139 Transcript_60/m.139 type:complete len:251 (-) Transcript_60:117-869(-)